MSTDASKRTPETETVALDTNAAGSTMPSTGKRFTKRSWIAMSASAGALIVAAAVAVPVISSNIAYGNAIDALTVSETEVTDAHASLEKATADLAGTSVDAATVYAESGEFVKVTRKELLADPSTLEELAGARAELAEVAELKVEGDVATAPAKRDVPALPAQDMPATMDAIADQTQSNEVLTEDYSKDTDTVLKAMAEIEAQSETIADLTEAVVESGAKYGATVKGLEKANPKTIEELKKALAAMKDKKTPAIGRVATFVTAYDKAKREHTAAEAAEKAAAQKAAAEKAAAEEAARRPNSGGNGGSSSGGSSSGGHSSGGSSNGGSSSGSSSNRPSTGGSSSGGSSNRPSTGGSSGGSSSGGSSSGGSSSGGSSSGGSSSGGSSGGSTNRTPATFERGSGYVPYSSGSCSFYSSHQVGWGGTSLGGRSLGSQGLTWSATAKGDTVTYYLCGW